MKTSALKFLSLAGMTGLLTSNLACKTLKQNSRLESLQTLHKGGLSLLWHADDKNVYVRACSAPLLDATLKINSLTEFRNACALRADTEEVTISRTNFVKVAVDSMLNDSGFRSLVKGAESLDELNRTASISGKVEEVSVQLNTAYELYKGYQEIAEKLKEKKTEAAKMEGVVRIGVESARGSGAAPTPEDYEAIFGDAYQKVSAELLSYEELSADKSMRLADLVKKLKESYEVYLDVQERLMSRFSNLAEKLVDPELQTLSVLSAETLDYEIFAAVATRHGLFVSRKSLRASCAKNESGYHVVGPDDHEYGFVNLRYNKEGCDEAVAGSDSGFVCVLSNKDDDGQLFSHLYDLKTRGRLIDGLVHSMCLAMSKVKTEGEFCKPTTIAGEKVVALTDRSGTIHSKFDGSTVISYMECVNETAKRNNTTAPALKTTVPPGVLTPVTTVGSFDIAKFLADRGVQVAKPAPQQPSQTNQPSQPNQPSQSGGITAADVDAAIASNRKKYPAYNADASTVGACVSAGKAASWSDKMNEYYCTLPIFKDFPGSGQEGERHCFTGALRGEGKYASLGLKGKYKETVDYCIGQPQFKWIVDASQEAVFRAVMVDKKF